MRRIDAYRTMKSTRDAVVKLMTSDEALKLKLKRKAFRVKQQKQLERLEQRVRSQGDNKLQTKLTSKQESRRNKQIKRNIAKTRKLKYSRSGGDISQGKVIDKEQWQSNFYSSNVWKFKVKGKNLMVGFLDGSIYIYFGAGRLFLGMLRAGSKGKFIWKNLRRKSVNYIKVA